MLSTKELEVLRPWISGEVTRVLGFSESTIVSTAVDCIGRSLNRQATSDQLSPYLEQKTDDFVMNLYLKVMEIKSSKLTSSSSLTGLASSTSQKKRSIQDCFNKEEEDEDDIDEPPKKKRVSRFAMSSSVLTEEEENKPSEVPTETSDVKMPMDIKAMLADTRRQIEERRKQTQNILGQQNMSVPTRAEVAPLPVSAPLLPLPQPVPAFPLPLPLPQILQQQEPLQQNILQQALLLQRKAASSSAIADRYSHSVHPLAYARELQMMRGMAVGPSALDKAIKAAELQAQIKSQLAAKPELLKSATTPGGPAPLILDAEGRTVDSSGRTISITPRVPQFMVNLRAKQRITFKQVSEKKNETREEKEAVVSSYHDSRIAVQGIQRNRRHFKFNEPGKYIKQAQMVRAKTQLEQLQSEIASVARRTGISSATKLALIAPSMDQLEETVNIEWWDAAILTHKSYAKFDDPSIAANEKYQDISNLIEHPIIVLPPGELAKVAALPVMLTAKERKKLRRQRRKEAEKEKQEKIQFGLIDRPEPKVRISNLMRVLGNEAVQDPTKIEAYVRAQMAERQKKHEKANAQRKLNPEQRKAKKIRKMKEDLSCGVHVTVFRVRDMSNPALKFKVDMNAQQHHLTGCVLLYQDVNIVIVEGGPKSLKKYKSLMMKRIKWKPKGKGRAEVIDDDEDSDDEGHTVHQKACTVVWEGKVLDRAFSDWKVRYFPTENLARDHLKRHGVEHYWDLALSQSIVEQDGD